MESPLEKITSSLTNEIIPYQIKSHWPLFPPLIPHLIARKHKHNHKNQQHTHQPIKTNHISPSFPDFSIKTSSSRAVTNTKPSTTMATVTSAAVTIPSFTGLKVGSSASKPTTVKAVAAAPKFAVKASWKDFGVAVAASAAIASNALAIEVLLGGGDGSLAFIPGSFEVASGETITFKNNAGFPHNVVFDEDEVPSGVDVAKISMAEENLLNAKDEVYTVTLTEKGTYAFYCAPHVGAGMKGTVTVK